MEQKQEASIRVAQKKKIPKKIDSALLDNHEHNFYDTNNS